MWGKAVVFWCYQGLRHACQALLWREARSGAPWKASSKLEVLRVPGGEAAFVHVGEVTSVLSWLTPYGWLLLKQTAQLTVCRLHLVVCAVVIIPALLHPCTVCHEALKRRVTNSGKGVAICNRHVA